MFTCIVSPSTTLVTFASCKPGGFVETGAAAALALAAGVAACGDVEGELAGASAAEQPARPNSRTGRKTRPTTLKFRSPERARGAVKGLRPSVLARSFAGIAEGESHPGRTGGDTGTVAAVVQRTKPPRRAHAAAAGSPPRPAL